MNEFLSKYQKVPVQEYPNNVNNNPIVSVCVLTYQHVNFIKQCIDGILMQKTNFDFEILLGEDESIDGTREICIEYAKKYPGKIRLFLHSQKNNIKINGQATGRFNLLYNFNHANGKYIALCEGDDYWTDPYKLQKQVDFLEVNPDYAICFHSVKICKGNEYKLVDDELTRELAETSTIKDLAMFNYIRTASVMYRNKLFDKFPSYFMDAPIGDYFLHMLNARFGKIKKLDSSMAVYRIHPTSYWSSLPQETMNRRLIPFLRKIKINFDNEIKKIIDKQIINLFIPILKCDIELGASIGVKVICNYSIMGKENSINLIFNKALEMLNVGNYRAAEKYLTECLELSDEVESNNIILNKIIKLKEKVSKILLTKGYQKIDSNGVSFYNESSNIDTDGKIL